jgi:two-component system copper resistance phosphate regulon response regulator CusR
MKILIIEDEESLAQLLKRGLETQGYAVDYLTDGEAGQKRIEYHHKDYDLIILDLMLPKKSGNEICKSVREMGVTTPIIILTAKSDTFSKISMLDIGADDYMVKPFEFSELSARIRALVRRPKVILPTELKVGDITLNQNTRKVFKGNKIVILTLKEFRLLEYLMRRANEVVKRVDLIDNIWDFDYDSFSNIIDVYINRLRDKMDKDRKAKLIETIIGVGYRLNA